MIYLRALKPSGKEVDTAEYPMRLPLLQNMQRLAFPKPVTLLCGDNGCGKTTLMELLALKVNAVRIDGREVEKPKQFEGAERAFLPEMVKRPRRSFFFQAEDFVRFIRRWFVAGENTEEADTLAYEEMLDMYGADLSAQSHGEGFLTFFGARIIRGGLYLLDEPEAALSPANQLVLLHLVAQAVAQDCQFIISTHSPVMLAYPEACVYQLRDGMIDETTYDRLEHVQFLRAFLNDTEGFLGRM